MAFGTLLILLLLLACPTLMVFMHRGGHRHGAAGEGSGAVSLDELRSRRAELDDEIARLEAAETETEAPSSVGAD